MSHPIAVDIVLSDSDSDSTHFPKHAISTPPESQSKRPRTTDLNPNPTSTTVFLIDDDPTPQKPTPSTATPSVVPETPMTDLSIVKCTTSRAPSSFPEPKFLDLSSVECTISRVSDSQLGPSSCLDPRSSAVCTKDDTFFIENDSTSRKLPLASTSTSSFVPETPLSDLSLIKCTSGVSDPQLGSSSFLDPKPSGISGLICLESDSESENSSGSETWKQNRTISVPFEVGKNSDLSCGFIESTFSEGNASTVQVGGESALHPKMSEIPEVHDNTDEEIDEKTLNRNGPRPKGKRKNGASRKGNTDDISRKKRITKEERIQSMKEKKQQKEQEKLHKAALKAEAVEMKKLQKENKRWETGKCALKSIVVEIDTKVIELGSVGGCLLTRLAEKGLTYRVTSNAIERSIVWTMDIPEQISQLSSRGVEIPYVLLVYEAEEFCNLVSNEFLTDHVALVRSRYPSHTVFYLTNRLMAYINKREQGQYKNPSSYSGWRRPPVEEVLSKLTTHFTSVHSRQCIDEAELAEHVVGLTCSLASCQFRKKLTRLSVNACGSLPKDCVDKAVIKKSLWLKALVAIPKVQPRFAIAIWKKYPTMKSLLSVYMDPSKAVHEKEFLLEDLITEGLLGEDRRLGEVCSKRVYRILMAQCGSILTDDVEHGADFFSSRCSS